MTTTTPDHPNIPVPVGADPDIWEEDDPPRQSYRVLFGVPRGVAGHKLVLQSSAVQYADGTLDMGDQHPSVELDIHYDDRLTSDQARDLAESLIEAAAEIDGWVGR